LRGIIALAGALALAVSSFAAVASASGPGIVGTYSFDDLGQGAWGNGPLYADGSVGGGGHFSYENGQDVGIVTATGWTSAGPGLITLCFTDTPTKGDALFPSPSCFTLPITGTPIKIQVPGSEVPSLLRVRMR